MPSTVKCPHCKKVIVLSTKEEIALATKSTKPNEKSEIINDKPKTNTKVWLKNPKARIVLTIIAVMLSLLIVSMIVPGIMIIVNIVFILILLLILYYKILRDKFKKLFKLKSDKRMYIHSGVIGTFAIYSLVLSFYFWSGDVDTLNKDKITDKAQKEKIINSNSQKDKKDDLKTKVEVKAEKKEDDLVVKKVAGTEADENKGNNSDDSEKNYSEGLKLFNHKQYKQAVLAFSKVPENSKYIKDIKSKIQEANNHLLKIYYDEAVELFNNKKYEQAVIRFNKAKTYKDSASYLKIINNLQNKEDKKTAKVKVKGKVKGIESKYKSAIRLYRQKSYKKAELLFKSLGNYESSKKYVKRCNDAILWNKYIKAIKLFKESKFSKAKQIFNSLNGYKESKDYIKQIEQGPSN